MGDFLLLLFFFCLCIPTCSFIYCIACNKYIAIVFNKYIAFVGGKMFMGFVITFPHLKIFFLLLWFRTCVASVMLLDSDLQIEGSIISNVKNFTLIFL